jgi:hypothetical protein
VPAALLALVALPALWWLLRVTPPAPRRLTFPPVRLLFALVGREQEAVRTPPWLLLLRLLLAALLIVAASRPAYNAGDRLPGNGPLVLVVDNGWAAAPTWRLREQAMADAIDAAEREGRGVLLLPTAESAGEDSLPPAAVLPAAKVRGLAASLKPQPFATERSAALARIRAAGVTSAGVLWLSDGLSEAGSLSEAGRSSVAANVDPRRDGASADQAFVQALSAIGPLRIVTPNAADVPPLLRADLGEAGRFEVTAVRAHRDVAATLSLRLIAEDGTPLAREALVFPSGSAIARVTLDLAAEWRQQVARLDIEDVESAGAVVLVDQRWQRRAVGIAGEAGALGEQPLLGRTFFVERALAPYAEMRTGTIAELMQRQLGVLILADVGRLDGETATRVRTWVEAGGVLIRFAGPRLAEAAGGEPDPLLPLPLRPGDRVLGGALSWGEGGRLASFEASGPLAGLMPSPDVVVSRQVLAEPTLEEAARTWARLSDGTPLITGLKAGAGWLVLIHTTANTDWSSFALSGLFVEVLRRIIDLSVPGGERAEGTPLPPVETLDGFGRLGAPPKEARTLVAGELANVRAGPHHPPGYYGRLDARVAVNLSPALADPRPLTLPRLATSSYGAADAFDPLPWLLAAALVLVLIDLGVSLKLRGFLPGPPRRLARRTVLAAALALALVAPASAQTVITDGTVPPPAVTIALAYVITGDAETDRLSRAALTGLATVVNRRTAAELAPPVGVRPERDELAFYPLIYWPLVEPTAMPTPQAARRLAAYMRAGGTILFDVRGGRSLAERADLRPFARALDLPPLVPVGPDHVLRRSYYLLNDLPGRFTGGPVWVEASGEHVNDGVSSVIAGANDWAGAWAVDDQLRPLKAVVPGGERQRELAYRFGINLVMYVLTGNYKTDQVHLPAILDRLRGPAK